MNHRFRILLVSSLWMCGGWVSGFVGPVRADPVPPGVGQEERRIEPPVETAPPGEGAGVESGGDTETAGGGAAEEPDIGAGTEETGAAEEGPPEAPEQGPKIRDPLMPVNRAFFRFNDRMYYWVVKPVAVGYKKVVPEVARIGVRNFFSNVQTPGRFINCLLQAKFKGAGIELARFAVNTTAGVAGFGDPARTRLNLTKREEDFGQTLGVYGLGPVIYLHWPILGPSSVRGTLGYAGDFFMDPVNYVLAAVPFDTGFKVFGFLTATLVNSGVKAMERVNDTSLTIGQYEELERAALDPYIAVRNAYYQHREYMIRH
jgi:phospholipid-binding lipoprotein MlaA